MTTATLFALTLTFALPPDDVNGATDRAAYEHALKAAGHDSPAQVKLALWCEAHGMSAERVKHLARAVLIDPKNTTARGLLGLVDYRGHWNRPDAVAEKVNADADLAAKLAEYNAKRASAKETADDQGALALWCEQNGLDAEAKAHYAAVVRLDPKREAAWRKLGCKKVNGYWVTNEQLAAEKAENDAQKAADKKWKPLLTHYQTALHGKSHANRDHAVKALEELSDPRAVPSVWSVFILGAKDHASGLRLLGQIDSLESSQALALLAVFDENAQVRRDATDILKRRDVREFAGLLVKMLRKPVKYEVRRVNGAGSTGVLFVEGEQFNVRRLYTAQMPTLALKDSDGNPINTPLGTVQAGSTGRIPGDQLLRMFIPDPSQVNPAFLGTLNNPTYGAAGPMLQHFLAAQAQTPQTNILANVVKSTAKNERTSPSRIGFGLTFGVTTTTDTAMVAEMMQIEAQRAAMAAEQQLEFDIATVDTYNDGVTRTNDGLRQVLTAVAGNDLGADLETWKGWFVNQLGYNYTPPEDTAKPTLVENVTPAYQPQVQAVASQSLGIINMTRMSCFGAGTQVRTLQGARPIEELKVGDRVLTENIRTGALGYQAITVVHHNPPSPTYLIKIKGETIVSSPFHRFWVAGKGWIMARDMKGGESLRLLDGPAIVESVDDGPVQPVFNLDVADDHDFFAGSSAVLVHDNSLPDTRLTPFDAGAAVTTSAR